MGIDVYEAARRNAKVAHFKSLEELRIEVLRETELAYQYVGNTYAYSAMVAAEKLVRRLGDEVVEATVEAELSWMGP